jgi:hypothetical protein
MSVVYSCTVGERLGAVCDGRMGGVLGIASSRATHKLRETDRGDFLVYFLGVGITVTLDVTTSTFAVCEGVAEKHGSQLFTLFFSLSSDAFHGEVQP